MSDIAHSQRRVGVKVFERKPLNEKRRHPRVVKNQLHEAVCHGLVAILKC